MEIQQHPWLELLGAFLEYVHACLYSIRSSFTPPQSNLSAAFLSLPDFITLHSILGPSFWPKTIFMHKNERIFFLKTALFCVKTEDKVKS